MPSEDIHALRERAKELRCLYRIHEIVSQRGQAPPRTFLSVLEAIPEGWQRPESTGARIEYLGRSYVGPGFSSSGQSITAPIRLGGIVVGCVEVSDASAIDDESTAFLDEERQLLHSIAHRLGEYLEWKHTELLGERPTADGVHWRWREHYAQRLAALLDAERYGISALFLGGSTEGGNAGPGSDIDLLVVCTGSELQRDQASHWFEGWSLCLAELAFRQTGYAFPGGILNIQWVTESPDLSYRPDLRSLQLGVGTSALDEAT